MFGGAAKETRFSNGEAIFERGRSGDFRRGLMRELDKYYSIDSFDVTDAIMAKGEKVPFANSRRLGLEGLKLANQHAIMTLPAATAKADDT